MSWLTCMQLVQHSGNSGRFWIHKIRHPTNSNLPSFLYLLESSWQCTFRPFKLQIVYDSFRSYLTLLWHVMATCLYNTLGCLRQNHNHGQLPQCSFERRETTKGSSVTTTSPLDAAKTEQLRFEWISCPCQSAGLLWWAHSWFGPPPQRVAPNKKANRPTCPKTTNPYTHMNKYI